MLQITIPSIEQYDNDKNEFSWTKECVLQLEHSLVSLSKWESKWHKPFLTREGYTIGETVDYIRCMTINQNVDQEVYKFITRAMIDQVNDYIKEPMTATTFAKDNSPPNREIVTAEIIYHWMITFGIPFECQKWNLNRLLTLINVCNIKSKPPKKRSRQDILSRNAAINEARLKALGTKG